MPSSALSSTTRSMAQLSAQIKLSVMVNAEIQTFGHVTSVARCSVGSMDL
jgi:hypothetical protein